MQNQHSPSPSQDSLADAAARFSNWARDELFREEHRVGTRILDEAVDCHLIDLYRQMQLHDHLQDGRTAAEVSTLLGYNDSAHIAVEAMLRRLAARCDFVSIDESSARFTAGQQPDARPEQLTSLREEMAALGSEYEAPLEFLQFGAEHFIHCMRDDPEFMDRVLTGQEKEHEVTWHRATNTDPLQDVHGVMGAKAVELLFEGGSILEVGGGTGNGLRNNIPALQQAGKLDLLDDYVFTDVSMQFILNTRRELKDKIPTDSCSWRLLNINKDFTAQRIAPNSADLIYGVNAAHIAKHMIEFMQQCITTLKPGGRIVFSERIRRSAHEMAPREIVLNQSSYHRTAAIRHPAYRPAHAYLAREHWLEACRRAGFSRYAVWPSVNALEHYFPEQYAVVVVAER